MMIGLNLAIGRSGGGNGGGPPPDPDKHQQIDTLFTSATWNEPAGDYWHPDGTADNVEVQGHGVGGGGSTNVGAGGGASAGRGKYAPGGNVSVTITAPAANTNGADVSFGAFLVIKGGLSGANGGTGGQAAACTADEAWNGSNGTIGTGNQTGGGGAGIGANASGANGGALDGGFGSLAGLARALGAGGGSSAGAQQAGAVGQISVIYDVEATAGFPRNRGRTHRTYAAGTSHTLVLPDDVQVGDRLVMVAFSGGNGSAVPTIGTSGAVWTQVGAQQNDATNILGGAVFTRVADGSDASALTLSSSEEAVVFIWREENAGVPTFTPHTAATANADPASHDHGSSAKIRWLTVAAWDSNILTYPTAFPSGYGSIQRAFQQLPAIRLVAGASERFNEAQTENPGAFTSVAEQHVVFTIAIPPQS